MSVILCSKCEKPIDTDLDEGYYCHECDNFSCEECIANFTCPICETEIEE